LLVSDQTKENLVFRLSWSILRLHFVESFYLVRQGSTWSRNYKSPSPSASSSDRFRIFSKCLERIFTNFLQIFANFMQTFCKFFDNFLTTVWQFWQLFDNLLTTFDIFLTTLCQLLNKFMTTFYKKCSPFWQLFQPFFYIFLFYHFCHTFLPLALVAIIFLFRPFQNFYDRQQR
jgi:hypothetical protein